MNSKEKSNFEDLELLRNISTGDENSLAILYDKYQCPVYSLVTAIVGVKEESLEIMENIFLEVWKKASLFDNGGGSFKAWLYTLAHNKSINALHSKRYKKSPLDLKKEITQRSIQKEK